MSATMRAMVLEWPGTPLMLRERSVPTPSPGDIPSFPYRLLWQERQLLSVANLTRDDARQFLRMAPQAGVRCAVTRYPLPEVNRVLADLREGRLQGAAVLIP